MIQKSASQQLEIDLDLSGIKERKEDSSSRDQSDYSKLNKLLRQKSPEEPDFAQAFKNEDEPNMANIFGVNDDNDSKASEIIDHNDPRALINAF